MTSPLLLFLFAGLFSPGPNVILITASAARFGFWRTLPHLTGVIMSSIVIGAAAGFGIGAILLTLPGLKLAFQICAAGWILWLAWKIFRASQKRQEGRDRPMTVLEAMAFNFVNPKFWAVMIAASSAYGAGLTPWGEGLRIGLSAGGMNLLACGFWSLAGAGLALLLTSEFAWRVFSASMAALLAASAFLVFL